MSSPRRVCRLPVARKTWVDTRWSFRRAAGHSRDDYIASSLPMSLGLYDDRPPDVRAFVGDTMCAMTLETWVITLDMVVSLSGPHNRY